LNVILQAIFVQGSEKSLNPVGKIAKKNNLKCVFVNSALKIPCNVTKIHS